MSNSLEKLTFTILLLDKISQPAEGVCKSIQKIQAISKDGFQSIGKGWAGLTAGAIGLNSFTAPARDFTKALGEVKSLGVAEDELDKLGSAGKRFAMQFGGNAAEIVRSGYDIQSAIPGLAKGALSEFTYQGSLLAKATKSNAETITKYQGTMYSIFEADAQKIGASKWIDQLTGKTAYAVQMFKTTGNEMSAAFTNLGAIGKLGGISMNEQMSVLGTLQGTMGGANAGTSYKAFLSRIKSAEETLGLSFTDAKTKKMLPMVEILEKIKNKVGEGALKTADQADLFEAFGQDGGKAVMNLLGKTEQLKNSIAEMNKINSSSNALKMAEDMTDPLERFHGVLGVIKTTLGQTMLPVINSMLSVSSRVMIGLEWLLENIPPLRWLLATLIFSITGISIAMGSLYMISGISKLFRAFCLELRMVYA